MKPVKKRVVRRKSGYEPYLVLLLLGFVGASSLFLFFLGSKDMRNAQKKSEWSDNIGVIIDSIITELSNCGAVEFPVEGEADHCLFRRSVGVGGLAPSLDLEGFLFSEGSLVHIVRNASGGSDVCSFQGVSNPLLTGLKGCEFRRTGPRLLQMTFTFLGSDADGEGVKMARSVFLKNH